MALSDNLIDTFDRCIDRLNAGESLDTILQDYPSQAPQLRPMLESGQVVRRARIPVEELTPIREAGERRLRQDVRETFRRRKGFPRWGLPLLVLGILGVLLAALSAAWIGTGDSTTPTPAAAETLVIPSPAASASPQTPTAITAAPRLITVDGPVSAITGSTLTVYDLSITLAPDDPVITVIRLGDRVRVEGAQSAAGIQASTVELVGVLVVIGEAQAWRGDDCASPPPDWARAAAADWFSRCTGPTGESGSGGGSADDDDDD